MKNADVHWDPATVGALTRRVQARAVQVGRPVTLMEVCGTHTHAIAEAGLRRLLPEAVRLIAGPGCPVCVTPIEYMDRAEALAELPGTTLCTFGDLMRVPSTRGSLEQARTRGCDVRPVYSPRDALRIAREEPERRIVFLAVGFETTVPTMAAALAEAEAEGIDNFLLLPGGKLIEPPLRALVADGEVEVDGFLLPGHVSVIIGADAYAFLVDEFGIPAAVVGFTPTDILLGVEDLLEQLADRKPRIANHYKRVVRAEGNPRAQALVDRFFVPVDSRWRGLGEIPGSALGLRPLGVEVPVPREVRGCRCGEVLKGTIDPPECPLFDQACTPERPLGACMVSSEGTCAAWYRHERLVAGATA
jgi:hydrogenase expression/formation protein HypD